MAVRRRRRISGGYPIKSETKSKRATRRKLLIEYPAGTEVVFKASTGRKFEGIVKGITPSNNILVHLGDDPFPVELGVDKLTKKEYKDTMTANTTTTTRKRAAKATTAAAPARRSRAVATKASATETEAPAKKAPAKKTAAKKAPAKAAAPVKTRSSKSDPSTWPKQGKNPYRPGSNLAKITDVLLKGGVRSALVTKLQAVIDMHPYTQVKEDLDVEKELDKRLMLTAGLLERDYGFTIVKTGRGMSEGTIKVVPPAA